MLRRLYLENFALADKLELEFGPGLNVLTGETGAGKSIIIGAIARLLGEKSDKDDIRSGANLAVVEGDFDIKAAKEIQSELDTLGIVHDRHTVTLRREIFLQKASRLFVNGQQITLGQIRPLADLLGQLYGQHSHQLLLDEKNHLGFLDDFAGLREPVAELRTSFGHWQACRAEKESLIKSRDFARKERELLIFQKQEIEKSSIVPGEEESLAAEKKIIDSARVLAEKTSAILEIIDRGNGSALNLLGEAQREISRIIDLDKTLEKKSELLDQAVINLEEFRNEIESYQASIPDDPRRQEEINLRLDELFRLKKKYGGSEEAILATLTEISHRLENELDVEDKIAHLEKEEIRTCHEYTRRAQEISGRRLAKADELSRKVEKELSGLGMAKAKFFFEFNYEADNEGIIRGETPVKPTAEGLESGRFMVSANPGEPAKALAKTASGGEISRIMLALRAAGIHRKKTGGNLLVFDEIDVGIGGQTARAVADKLKSIASEYQLLVVTHLHQIAAVSDYHYAVQKVTQSKGGRNIVVAKGLDKKERALEIERMLALPDTLSS